MGSKTGTVVPAAAAQTTCEVRAPATDKATEKETGREKVIEMFLALLQLQSIEGVSLEAASGK